MDLKKKYVRIMKKQFKLMRFINQIKMMRIKLIKT